MEIEVVREKKALPPPRMPPLVWHGWEVPRALVILGQLMALLGVVSGVVMATMAVAYGFITMEGYRGPFFASDVVAWAVAFSIIPFAILARLYMMVGGGQMIGGSLFGGKTNAPSPPPRTANDAYDGEFDDRPKPKSRVVDE